jgi:drug/metabolite transporter (DMT)-like permease
MSSQALGIIIGGLVPAVLFGFTNLFIKSSTEEGIGLPIYLIVVGLAAVMIGCILAFFFPDRSINITSGSYAFAAGALWALGIACIAFTLQKYGTPMSVLVPLFNMNTLIAVLLALWLFAEWKQVHVPKLLLGTVLMTVGGALVARA